MKLSKYYSYIIIGVLFPVFLYFSVAGERRNKSNKPVDNTVKKVEASDSDNKRNNSDKYTPMDAAIDAHGDLRLMRAAVFAQFLFAEHGKGDRIITGLAKTPGYKYERIGFRGLKWGTDVSQIDDFVLPPRDTRETDDFISSRKGDKTEINMPLVIDSRFIGKFYIQGTPMYHFHKNKLVEVIIIMVAFPEDDKLVFGVNDTLGPPSYISSDNRKVWDGNITDISLAFERSEFMGKTMHTYKIVLKKSDDP